MDNILVTGGLGFLGAHIVNRLIKMGENVTIFARPTKHKTMPTGDVPIVWGDIRDKKAVRSAIQNATQVIHLVSNFRKGGSDKNEAFDINVLGTQNVLDACNEFDVKRLVHCSTIGVHGSVKEIPANEKTPFNPGDLYQTTKLEAEKRVHKAYNETKLPLSVIRPISMFGPGDLRMLKLFRMIKKKRFIILGDGTPYFQPAYIDDVVNGFILALSNDKAVGETFIVGGEEYVTLNQLCKLIANTLNVPPPKLKIPIKPVLILADICEKACVPLGIEPPIHRRRVRFFQNNRAFDVSKAQKILGFKSETTLQQGIKKTIAWYEKKGLL